MNELLDQLEFLVYLSEFIEYYKDNLNVDILNEIITDRIYELKESLDVEV
jgi:hypothetical protein